MKKILLGLVLMVLLVPSVQALNSYCIDKTYLFVDESYWYNGEYMQMNHTDTCPYGCSVNLCIERGEIMAFDALIAMLFVSVIGFACLFLAFKREDSIMWPVFATIIFSVLGFSALNLNISGGLNYILSGVFLIFMFLSLMKCVSIGFDYFKGKARV